MKLLSKLQNFYFRRYCATYQISWRLFATYKIVFSSFFAQQNLFFWNSILSCMLRQKGKLQLSSRLYICHYRLSFYWLFPLQMFAIKSWFIYIRCHPITFLSLTLQYLATKTQKGGFFNNNLMTLCVRKCIYSTWRGITLRISRSLDHNGNLFCAKLSPGYLTPLSLSIVFAFCANKTKPQPGKDFHDANGELL